MVYPTLTGEGKIKVKVNGGEVLFEQDVEGRYKARVRPVHMEREGGVDVELIMAIVGVVEEAVN